MVQRLMSAKRINRIVARMARREVHSAARDVAGSARGNLAAHRDDGTHRVRVSRGAIDSFATLEGPAAMSLEYGHFVRHSNTYVQGMRIMRDAAGG